MFHFHQSIERAPPQDGRHRTYDLPSVLASNVLRATMSPLTDVSGSLSIETYCSHRSGSLHFQCVDA